MRCDHRGAGRALLRLLRLRHRPLCPGSERQPALAAYRRGAGHAVTRRTLDSGQDIAGIRCRIPWRHGLLDAPLGPGGSGKARCAAVGRMRAPLCRQRGRHGRGTMMFSGWSTRQVMAALFAQALRRAMARVTALVGSWSPPFLTAPVPCLDAVRHADGRFLPGASAATTGAEQLDRAARSESCPRDPGHRPARDIVEAGRAGTAGRSAADRTCPRRPWVGLRCGYRAIGRRRRTPRRGLMRQR